MAQAEVALEGHDARSAISFAQAASDTANTLIATLDRYTAIRSGIAQARNDSWSFLNGVINGTFTVPGDGSIDYKAALTVLRNAGYEGWLVVEAE